MFSIKILLIFLRLFLGTEGIAADPPSIEPARPIDIVIPEAPDEVRKGYFSRELDSYKMPLDSVPERTLLRLGDSYSWPYAQKVRSGFGRRFGRHHDGVDIPLATGTEVTAAFDGVVRVATYSSGYGNIIILRHPSGIETAYAHLSSKKVKAGDEVKAGDVIALSGSSGRSTGPHLHFETTYCGHPFDPELIFDFESGRLSGNTLMLRREVLK